MPDTVATELLGEEVAEEEEEVEEKPKKKKKKGLKFLKSKIIN